MAPNARCTGFAPRGKEFMNDQNALPGWKDKALYTPGPLTTSASVKQAMLRDLGSRDGAFIAVVREIRDQLVRIATESPTPTRRSCCRAAARIAWRRC